MPTIAPDASQDASLAAPTLYLVRVTTRHGSYSVGWDDPARVLQAVADFQANGFGQVGVYGVDGRRIELAALAAAAGRT